MPRKRKEFLELPNQFLADVPGHLVTVHLDDGVLDLNLGRHVA